MRKTICLNMIVKDESHVLEKTLENLCQHITFNYWVICDTGSTDGTQDIIVNFFKTKGIPGELVQHEWRDFGHNRTEALRAAYKKADYIFIFDADDTVHGKLVIPPYLDKDFYKFQFGSGFTYYRPLLVTAQKKSKFVGVLHEFLSLEEGVPSEGVIEGSYFVDSGKTGSRSRDKDKYLKDATILKNAYAKEVETGGGLANRYAFYCAQSFKDCNRIDDAIEWYTLVADKLNSWVQERYYSCLMLGNLYKTKDNFEKSLEYFLKAQQFDPDRSEGTIFAAELLHQRGHHYLVTLLYESNKKYNKDPQDKLFLYRDFYNDILEYNCSLSAFHCGKRDLAYSCIKTIILNSIANQGILKNCFYNLRAHARELNADPDTFGLFNMISYFLQSCDGDTRELCVLWNILFSKHRAILTAPSKFKCADNTRPKVFLSMTSCKRLDLFKETVNSVLNCWMDANKIDYWFCVDDNSSKSDRSSMQKLYPWMKFYLKTPQEKGHRESMNIIWNKLKELKPKYWIHMEDDFLFYIKKPYVSEAMKFLDTHSDIKQVLFNRAYAETIEQVDMRGYDPISPGFVVHDHKQGKFPYPNCHYWPHYSFRPSMVCVDAILELGNYDSPNTFFEMDYAMKWTSRGYKSAFFDLICCRHIGRLTSERNTGKVQNAYDLNGENQFNTTKSMKILNLKRRPDRKEAMEKIMKDAGISEYEFVEAVDGMALKPTSDLKDLFEGNDFGNRRGFIGCALSHYNLWKALLADKSNTHYVIFEDDATLIPEFKDIYELLKPEFPKHEYLLLGYHMYSANRDATKDTYVTLKNKEITIGDMQNDLNVGGTFAYSINKKGAQTLVDYIGKHRIRHGIDYVVKVCRDLKCTELRPQIVFSEWCEKVGNTVDSDIQKNTDCLDFSNVIPAVDFEFIPGFDHIGDDIYYQAIPLEKMKRLAMDDPQCMGFNTLGFFKNNIDRAALTTSPYFGQNDGIYIKVFNTPTQSEPETSGNTIKVKMICNWSSSKDFVNAFPTKYPVPGLELTSRDDADYFVIVNLPTKADEYHDPKKTIVLQMEPWVYDDAKPWGVKTWMPEWRNPDPNKFLHSHTCRRFLNPAAWTLGGDLTTFPPKRSSVALICSDQLKDTGHQLRVNFAKLFPDLVRVYGKCNAHSLSSYVGTVRDEDRYNVYGTHKYVLAVENNSEVNYATEKIWEPIICESLTFYWGCPNLEEYIDPRSFVRLPLEDPAEAARIVKQAIDEDWWSQRIDAIKSAKRVIMEKYGMFQIISNVIQKHANKKPETYYSQDGQDMYLDTNVFKGFKNGVFVDVGANNGVHINNTLFFETNRDWTGVNIEPIKAVYDKLVNNRPNCINLNCAVSNSDGDAEFICNEGYTEMISGLKDQFDPRHAERLKNELSHYGGNSTLITVPTKRLDTILHDAGIKHVHYLSVDVEGAEFEVIKSINFDNVFIDVIGFENNYNDTSVPIIDYLMERGYSIIHKSMDIFMKHRDSKF